MSNSSLICYTKLSPNCTKPRNHAIDTITIHCMAGDLSVEDCGAMFAKSSRQASSNYGIGSDGRIALYVEECNRSWCSSNGANDHRAVTIEVANNGGEPDWPVSTKAFAALIDLVTDICQRNNIKQLLWKGNKALVGRVSQQNMTVHRWFANKACPGDYLYNRHAEIARQVNKRLESAEKEEPNMPVYKHLQDVPTSYRPAIEKLMRKGAMSGYSDPDPKRLDDNVIDVSEDFCRVMTILDRLGKLD